MFLFVYVPIRQQLSFNRITSYFVNIVFFSLKIFCFGMLFRYLAFRKRSVFGSSVGFKAKYADVNFL